MSLSSMSVQWPVGDVWAKVAHCRRCCKRCRSRLSATIDVKRCSCAQDVTNSFRRYFYVPDTKQAAMIHVKATVVVHCRCVDIPHSKLELFSSFTDNRSFSLIVLQVKGKDGHYFLAGIISWGIGCAEANLPGVCTRISKFTPWILENVEWTPHENQSPRRQKNDNN